MESLSDQVNNHLCVSVATFVGWVPRVRHLESPTGTELRIAQEGLNTQSTGVKSNEKEPPPRPRHYQLLSQSWQPVGLLLRDDFCQPFLQSNSDITNYNLTECLFPMMM